MFVCKAEQFTLFNAPLPASRGASRPTAVGLTAFLARRSGPHFLVTAAAAPLGEKAVNKSDIIILSVCVCAYSNKC